jgi:hypothetical protein
MQRADYNKLLPLLPRYGQRVLANTEDGGVYCADFGAQLRGGDEVLWQQASFELGRGASARVVRWHPGPDESEYRPGNHPPGKPDDSLVVRHHNQENFMVRKLGTPGKELPFPGFMGGEHRHFDRVCAWAPIPTAGWIDVPPEWLALPTYEEYRSARSEEWASWFASVLFNSVTNDGDLYKSAWEPLVENCPFFYVRYKLKPETDLVGGNRATLMLGYIKRQISVHAKTDEGIKSVLAEDDAPYEFRDYYGALQLATTMVRNYYRDRMKDGLRNAK